MKIYDELLNKYVDNELSTDELKNVKELVESNSEFKSDLKAHKFVDESLRDISVSTAPLGITEKIMRKISSAVLEKYKKNYFFRFIITVLTLILLSGVGFLLWYVSGIEGISETSGIATEANSLLIDVFSKIYKYLGNSIVKVIGSSITLLLLIGTYFITNSHKSFKRKLQKMS